MSVEETIVGELTSNSDRGARNHRGGGMLGGGWRGPFDVFTESTESTAAACSLITCLETTSENVHGAEFDATTWSARTWTSFTMQRISCALMVAVAWELAGAMGLASVGDTRDDDE